MASQNTSKVVKILTKGPLHMSPVTRMAWLGGRSLSLCHMGNFSPVSELRFQLVTVHVGNFSLATEMNKAQPFKFNWAGVFIWESF